YSLNWLFLNGQSSQPLNEKWFRDRNNNWYYITSSGQLWQWGGASPLATLNLAAYDDPNYLFRASVTSELAELRHDYGFVQVGNTFYQTSMGLNYKWFQSRYGVWYAVAPQGQLYVWTGGSNFGLVQTVGTAVYADPTQLFPQATDTLSAAAQQQLHTLQAA